MEEFPDDNSNKVGDLWTFVNVLPESSFIHTVHTAKRNEEEADKFIKKVKENSDGQAPLFSSDGFYYSESLYNNYSTMVPVPYSGKGRPCNPKRVIDSDLKYVQLIKDYKKGKLVSIKTQIVCGNELEILQIIDDSKRSSTINTSFVESRNGSYRKDDKRLTRKTKCHSKDADIHIGHINLLTGVYNYTKENESFRELINPNAKLFEPKYKKVSPAMKEGILDRILTLEELLMMRVPREYPLML